MPSLNHFLALSAILFTIGLFGALTKRNLIVILMSIEIMLNGINIALVAFANYTDTIVPFSGHVFALFVITVAAAEVAIGLALIIAVFRTRDTIDLRNINLLKW